MNWRKRAHGDNEAVGQVLGFIVAGTLFMAAVGAVLFAARDRGAGDQGSAEAAGRMVEAGSLLQVLAGSSGIGWANPDTVTRLGVGATNGSGLQMSSLNALRGAAYDASPANGKVDYAEAVASLGIANGTNFHLRMYPIALDTVFGDTLIGTKVGYVGDWVSLPAVSVSLATPASMTASAQAKLNLTITSMAQQERLALTVLGVAFKDSIHITAAQPDVTVDLPLLPDPPLVTHLGLDVLVGDVYPDKKSYIDAVLPGRLSNYEVLVIGSGVDQNVLTSSGTKNAIRDWVLAGGSLVVLGSGSQNFQWLQPLFSVGTANVNGGAFAPDVSHPLLHEPHELNWQAYSNYGLGWDIKDTGSGAHYNDFTHVVVEGGEDVLAVSNDGAFGTGRIFLMTYRPGDIAQVQGALEAMNFLTNIFLYAERSHLYLEYGPQIPGGVQVATAIRQSHLYDSEMGIVPVRLELHLW